MEHQKGNKETRTETIFDGKLDENFARLITGTKLQIQEAQISQERYKTNRQIKKKKTATSHITFKLEKTKDKEKS